MAEVCALVSPLPATTWLILLDSRLMTFCSPVADPAADCDDTLDTADTTADSVVVIAASIAEISLDKMLTIRLFTLVTASLKVWILRARAEISLQRALLTVLTLASTLVTAVLSV